MKQKEIAQQLINSTLREEVMSIAYQNGQRVDKTFNMALKPVTLKQKSYQNLVNYSRLWQKLLHKASLDSNLIKRTFRDCQNDEMISNLMSIFLEYEDKIGIHNQPKIDLLRNDFFLQSSATAQQETQTPKLIQYNSSCVSMAGLTSRYQDIHSKIWTEKASKMPKNNASQTHAKSLVEFYKEHKMSGCVAVVVLKDQTNVYDQKHLVQEIKKLGVCCCKIQYNSLMDNTRVQNDGKLLYIRNSQCQGQISIVYFRAGYSKSHQNFWEAKRKVVLSNAVCIPWIGSQLANMKRMQAQLSKKNVMSKFLSCGEVQQLMQTVIQTWEFSSAEDEQEYSEEQTQKRRNQILKMMEQTNKQLYVLKPNEDGGGHNYFGIDAYNHTKTMALSNLPNYILTRRVLPLQYQNSVIGAFVNSKQEKNEYKICSNCIIDSQFSIYGSVSSNEKGIIQKNICDGFLIRSKPIECNEGGLMTGKGIICALEIQK